VFSTQKAPPAAGRRRGSKIAPTLVAAFLTCLLLPVSSGMAAQSRPEAAARATAGGPGTRSQQEEAAQVSQETLLHQIETLEDSLEAARENLALGREQMNYLRRQIRRLDEELSKIEMEPGYEDIRERLLKLRRGLMESSISARIEMGPAEAPTPGMSEEDYWRRYFPEMGELGETRVRNEIFMVGRDVEVGVFEKVRGNVVVIGGRITVSGSVGGDVIAVGDDIRVTMTGRVGGDAWTVGGHIMQEPGGMIEGDWIDTSSFLPSNLFIFRHNPVTWFAFALTGIVFVLVAALLTGLVAPRNVDRIETQVRGRFGTSFLVGLVTEIALPFVVILLLITIIGIPVALILVPVLMVGLLLLGFTGVAKSVGRGASQRGLKLGESPLAMITIGVLLLESLYILSRALGFAPGVMTPIAFAGRLLGGLVLYIAWTTGLGAAIMTRFGTRMPDEPGRRGQPKPAPPPVGGEPTELAPTT
jgi:hypothetical protein